MSARDNVALAASRRKGVTRARAAEIADHFLETSASRTRRRSFPRNPRWARSSACPLAPALSAEPRFLLLDQPFSQFDSLTRFELQDILLRDWEESGRPSSW